MWIVMVGSSTSSALRSGPCSLGKHWKGKLYMIPVAEIREIWEVVSKKGRYTNKAIWAACAKELEEYQAMAAAQSSQHK